MFLKVLLLINTIRHLKLSLILSRSISAFIGITLDIPKTLIIENQVEKFKIISQHQERILSSITYRFLNATPHIKSIAGRNPPNQRKLWPYNPYCFDDLNANSTGRKIISW